MFGYVLALALIQVPGFEWQIEVKNCDTKEVKIYKSIANFNIPQFAEGVSCSFVVLPVEDKKEYTMQQGYLRCVYAGVGQMTTTLTQTHVCVDQAPKAKNELSKVIYALKSPQEETLHSIVIKSLEWIK